MIGVEVCATAVLDNSVVVVITDVSADEVVCGSVLSVNQKRNTSHVHHSRRLQWFELKQQGSLSK